VADPTPYEWCGEEPGHPDCNCDRHRKAVPSHPTPAAVEAEVLAALTEHRASRYLPYQRRADIARAAAAAAYRLLVPPPDTPHP